MKVPFRLGRDPVVRDAAALDDTNIYKTESIDTGNLINTVIPRDEGTSYSSDSDRSDEMEVPSLRLWMTGLIRYRLDIDIDIDIDIVRNRKSKKFCHPEGRGNFLLVGRRSIDRFGEMEVPFRLGRDPVVRDAAALDDRTF